MPSRSKNSKSGSRHCGRWRGGRGTAATEKARPDRRPPDRRRADHLGDRRSRSGISSGATSIHLADAGGELEDRERLPRSPNVFGDIAHARRREAARRRQSAARFFHSASSCGGKADRVPGQAHLCAIERNSDFARKIAQHGSENRHAESRGFKSKAELFGIHARLIGLSAWNRSRLPQYLLQPDQRFSDRAKEIFGALDANDARMGDDHLRVRPRSARGRGRSHPDRQSRGWQSSSASRAICGSTIAGAQLGQAFRLRPPARRAHAGREHCRRRSCAAPMCREATKRSPPPRRSAGRARAEPALLAGRDRRVIEQGDRGADVRGARDGGAPGDQCATGFASDGQNAQHRVDPIGRRMQQRARARQSPRAIAPWKSVAGEIEGAALAGAAASRPAGSGRGSRARAPRSRWADQDHWSPTATAPEKHRAGDDDADAGQGEDRSMARRKRPPAAARAEGVGGHEQMLREARRCPSPVAARRRRSRAPPSAVPARRAISLVDLGETIGRRRGRSWSATTSPRSTPSRSRIARCSRVCGIDAVVGGDDQQGEIDAGGAGQHVVDEALVAGHVDEADRARRRASADRQSRDRSRCRAPSLPSAGRYRRRSGRSPARSCRGRCGRRSR